MKSFRIIVYRLGGPEVLETLEEEVPEPGRGDARVRVFAAGVSLADLLMREGVHPEKTILPFTPGWDVVGVVEKVGADALQVKVGQMVAALPIHGGYAQHICLPQSELIPVPDGPGSNSAWTGCYRVPPRYSATGKRWKHCMRLQQKSRCVPSP